MILPVAIVIPFKVNSSGKTELWFQVRNEAGPLNGLLEWPGGKLEAQELPIDSAIRELFEETGVQVPSKRLIHFQNYHYKYDDRSVTLFVHLLKDLGEFSEEGWKSFSETDLEHLAKKVPAANIKILSDLWEYFKKITETKQWRDLWEIS